MSIQDVNWQESKAMTFFSRLKLFSIPPPTQLPPDRPDIKTGTTSSAQTINSPGAKRENGPRRHSMGSTLQRFTLTHGRAQSYDSSPSVNGKRIHTQADFQALRPTEQQALMQAYPNRFEFQLTAEQRVPNLNGESDANRNEKTETTAIKDVALHKPPSSSSIRKLTPEEIPSTIAALKESTVGWANALPAQHSQKHHETYSSLAPFIRMTRCSLFEVSLLRFR